MKLDPALRSACVQPARLLGAEVDCLAHLQGSPAGNERMIRDELRRGIEIGRPEQGIAAALSVVPPDETDFEAAKGAPGSTIASPTDAIHAPNASIACF